VIKGSKAPYSENKNLLEVDPAVKEASRIAYEIYHNKS
jgi:hypothetical protein